MRVREFIEWLAQFPDQDATVKVLQCRTGVPYVQQGSVTSGVEFDPERHVKYTDLRGNPWIKDDSPHKDTHTLLLGLNDG